MGGGMKGVGRRKRKIREIKYEKNFKKLEYWIINYLYSQSFNKKNQIK